MNNKQHFTFNSGRFDTAFLNPCIDKVLEAIEQVQKGLKVLLVFENSLTREDQFQFTQNFPLNYFDFLKSYTNQKLWKQLFLLCPHLVEPKKIIYSHSRQVKQLSKITDLLFGNEFNTPSEFMNQKTPNDFSFLKKESIEGVIFHEYKINVTRLYIEILKHYEKIGGSIRRKKSLNPKEVKTVIQCLPQNNFTHILPVKVPSNFSIVYKYQKYIIRFSELHNQLQVESINPAHDSLSKEELEKISNEFIHFEKEQVAEKEQVSFVSIKTIQNIIRLIKIPLPGVFENSSIKDNYELSLEKFDIAKQTGITYPEFKILYHRYGTGIDAMIDEAYEKMNIIRDPKTIWEMVENEYQIKYEWKI